MPSKLSVLVTGATGQQGGALARTLLAKGHKVLALTRKIDSPQAQTLKNLGAQLVTGNLEDRASIERAARGADAVFAVSVPFESGVEGETKQGINVADAAKAAGVRHLVFTSVPRADQNTGIPHFDSKASIERHIRSLGLPFTILGPAFFMENLLSPLWLPGLREGKFAIALPPNRKLQQIALADIGSFAAMVLENRDRFLGQRIDLASDERTGPEMAGILSRASGRKIDYVQLPLEKVRALSDDLAKMFEWFDRTGTGIDIAALRVDYPQIGWHTLDEWASQQNWDLLGQAAAD